MKRPNSPHLCICTCLVTMLFFLVTANAQDQLQPTVPKQPLVAGQPNQERPNLLGELGLSTDQIQQLRRMNADRKPLIDAANKRLREANRSLDQAIYGDAVDPAEFQIRLKEFQDAQAEVARIRFESELNVRRILTPDQLVRFREARRRFAEARKELKQADRPFRPRQQMRQLNRNQQLRPNP